MRSKADTNPGNFSTILQYTSQKNRLIDREVELDTNAAITLTHDSPMYHRWHREMWQRSVSAGNPWGRFLLNFVKNSSKEVIKTES